MTQQSGGAAVAPALPKPLLRGRIHAAAAVGAVIVTVALCWRSRNDLPRLISMLIFGLSMIELYTVSAVYHIGHWRPQVHRVLRSVDHANIFVLIAGTYTPLCFNVLTDWVRTAFLTLIWVLAAAGIGLSVFTPRVPRWVGTGLYIGMGWVSILALPAFFAALPAAAIALMVLGGVLYTLGAVVYGRKRPNPFPRVLGFHEIFHLFTVAAGAVFAVVIWIWVLPFPRV
jgi:hemolysin III